MEVLINKCISASSVNMRAPCKKPTIGLGSLGKILTKSLAQDEKLLNIGKYAIFFPADFICHQLLVPAQVPFPAAP